MKIALHGMVSMHSNVMSDIRLAAEAGYEGLEIHTEKLWRFLNSGGTAQMIKEKMSEYGIEVSAIDIIGGIEVSTKENIARVEFEADTLSRFAKDIGTKTIQLNAFEGLSALGARENIFLTAKMIKRIAKIGENYGIRFQYEGAAWTPIHTLQDCCALIDEVGENNFGHVIDFWHFWASRGATPEDIAKLPAETIYGVHCCGGVRPAMDGEGNINWVDERELRGYFPAEEGREGEEVLPAKEWMDAIKATGYDGWLSGEFLNDRLWERDNLENAIYMKKKITQLL